MGAKKKRNQSKPKEFVPVVAKEEVKVEEPVAAVEVIAEEPVKVAENIVAAPADVKVEATNTVEVA